jgi:hypothetical protein
VHDGDILPSHLLEARQVHISASPWEILPLSPTLAGLGKGRPGRIFSPESKSMMDS